MAELLFFPWERKANINKPEVFGMDVSIDKIFKYLSWDNDNEVQKYGIELASQISNLSVLIMPVDSNSVVLCPVFLISLYFLAI